MRAEINFQKFKSAIQLVERIAGKHVSLPILSCVLCEAKGNSLVLRATNLDVGAEVELSAKIDGPFTVALPGHTLSAFVSQTSDRETSVSLEVIGGNAQMKTSKSKAALKGVAADDFPPLPSVADGKKFSLPREALIKGLRSVWYSASVSSVKPELSSVYIYHTGEYVVFVATDSFRLAEKKVKIEKVSEFTDILIPFKNVSEIIRALEHMEETVEVEVGKNLISFSSQGIVITSRLIDGVFPDYRQIIPKSFSTEATVLKQDLIDALKISNIFSDKFNQVRFLVDPKSKGFSIETKNSDVGENNASVDAALTGEKLEINFNYKYIADSFQSIDADSLTLQLGGMSKPMVIRPVSGDQTFMYLVMPMNR